MGKSTLFNRLIGAREAIVHEQPGVTRDRHYANTEWSGKTFTLIDTGGYVPKSNDVFEDAIREQAQIAIDDANAIIFVVDGKDGPTSLDKDISTILRKSNKKIYLVVNKIDSDKRTYNVNQFYELGIGDLFSISAITGRNIGDFLDSISKDIPLNSQQKILDNWVKLAIVGKPNVGKSSLVNALLGKKRHIVTEIPGTTRDAIDSILTYQKENLLLIDTAGLRKKRKIKESIEFYSTIRALKSISRCDVAILIIDAQEGMGRQDLAILEHIIGQKKGVLIAVNKWDTIEKNNRTEIYYEKILQRKLRAYNYVPIIFISALKKQRIFKVIDLAKEVYQECSKRITTNELNSSLLKEIKSIPPQSKSGKEIKISFITQVQTNPPVFTFFVNEPKLIGEHYRRFLENKIREYYKFVGVPIIIKFVKKAK